MVQRVLPLYEKNQIKPDENTYMHIMKHYLAKRQTDLVISTYEWFLD